MLHLLVTTSTELLSTSRIAICYEQDEVPSGERLHSNGKSQFLMGKSTISMAIFNSYVSSPEGTWRHPTDQNGYCTVSTCVFASVVTCKAWVQTAHLRTAWWRRSSWTLNFDFFSHSAIQFRTPQNHFPRFCFKSIEFSQDFLDAYSPFFWFQASCGSLA